MPLECDLISLTKALEEMQHSRNSAAVVAAGLIGRFQVPLATKAGPDEYICGTCGAQWFEGIQQDCGHRKNELAYFKPSPCKATRI